MRISALRKPRATNVFSRVNTQFIFAQTNLMPMPAYMDIESLDSAFIGMAPLPDTVLSLYLDVQSNTNYTVYLLDNTDGTGGMQTLVVEDR